MDVDEKGIEPGEEWLEELKKQVSASEGVIACVSPDFLKSPYCRAEIEQAQRESKAIYPAIVRRLETGQSIADMNLSHLQYVDLTQEYRAGLKRLTQVLPRPMFPWRLVLKRLALAGLGLLALAVLFLVVMLGTQFGTPSADKTRAPSPSPTDSAIQGRLGIAVAYFDTSDLREKGIDPRQADRMVEQFGLLLDGELTASLAERMLLDYGYRGPEIVGRVQGEDLASSAEELARKFRATILVYGTVELDEHDVMQIEPAFVIDREQYADAWEITGHHRFGSPIPVVGDENPQDELSSRTQVLAYVVGGLADFLMEEDYEGARASFLAAQAVPGWSTMQGREVLNILLGNTYLRLAGRAAWNCDRDGVLDQVTQATAQFEEAVEVTQGTYFRPYSGLAAAKFLEARWSPPESDGCVTQQGENPYEPYDLAMLRESLDYIERANATGSLWQTEPVVYSRLRMNEARVMLVMCGMMPNDEVTQETIDGACSKFQALSGEVISLYEERGNPTVAEDAALAYGWQADLLQLSGDYYGAVNLYQKALEIPGIAPEHRMLFTGYIGDCYYWLAKLEDAPLSLLHQARRQYMDAREIAQSIRRQDDVAFYTDLEDMVSEEIRQQQTALGSQ
jgi:tetratricopeptide (TPR) repeat protein